MEGQIRTLYLQMEENLTEFADLGASDINKLTGAVKCVMDTMAKLKTLIIENPFESDAAEISFFKNDKPRFYSWLLYLVDEFGIMKNLPPGSAGMQRTYYLQELSFLDRTFERHRSEYQYYRDEESYRDWQYFLRRNAEPIRLGQEDVLPDPTFSTACDYLFAKFRAAEMLQDFLIRKIRQLENEPLKATVKPLRWTGEKINLVELAYGLYYTRQLNDGKAEIMDIIDWLQYSLSIQLTKAQAYRMYLDIRRRKTIPYTKFIDQVRDAIHQNIDDSYGLKPGKSTTKK